MCFIVLLAKTSFKFIKSSHENEKLIIIIMLLCCALIASWNSFAWH